MLVTYDVEVTSPGGARRLRRVSRACQDYGQRVQFSVFEIDVAADQWVQVRARLLAEIDVARDSLRFYSWGLLLAAGLSMSAQSPLWVLTGR